MFENDSDLKKIVSRLDIDTTPNPDHRDSLRRQMLSVFQQTQKTPPHHTSWQTIRRIIMKSKITKLATAAMIILIAVLGITLLDNAATPAWAIEQTVEALENIETLVITGTDSPESIPFKFWIKFTDTNSDSFDLRYETEKQIVVVRGTRAWAYRHYANTVKIYENVKDSEGMMRDLRFWYKIAQLTPWITGKVFAILKAFADDWQESYRRDEQTGQERVFVTCSYKPLSSSFWFVCDVDTKLIREGKYWRNTNRQGPPVCHAISFAYNEQISDEIFDFQIPEGAKVIDRKEQEEADALFERGEKLFHDKKQFAEAIKIYQQFYEKYPDLNMAESALMMIGICYGRLEQYDKAIEALEKAVHEYPEYTFCATYFYLGNAYWQTGQKDRALEAFKNCLITGEGIRDPKKFPLKNAREYIRKLEKKK